MESGAKTEEYREQTGRTGSQYVGGEQAEVSRRPSVRVVVEIALVCSLVAVITAGVALWSLSAALVPSSEDVSTMVSERLDGPGPLRRELARPDGPVVQSIAESIEANQKAYIDGRRGAVVRACAITALVGAALAALAGWFGASRALRNSAASTSPNLP